MRFDATCDDQKKKEDYVSNYNGTGFSGNHVLRRTCVHSRKSARSIAFSLSAAYPDMPTKKVRCKVYNEMTSYRDKTEIKGWRYRRGGVN